MEKRTKNAANAAFLIGGVLGFTIGFVSAVVAVATTMVEHPEKYRKILHDIELRKNTREVEDKQVPTKGKA